MTFMQSKCCWEENPPLLEKAVRLILSLASVLDSTTNHFPVYPNSAKPISINKALSDSGLCDERHTFLDMDSQIRYRSPGRSCHLSYMPELRPACTVGSALKGAATCRQMWFCQWRIWASPRLQRGFLNVNLDTVSTAMDCKDAIVSIPS